MTLQAFKQSATKHFYIFIIKNNKKIVILKVKVAK